MKALSIIFVLMFAAQVHFGQSVELPNQIVESLNVSYPGWRFSLVDAEVSDFVSERSPGAKPNLISGDFDGDGESDFAMLIEHSNFDEPGTAITHEMERLAFFRRGDGYTKYILEEASGANPIVYLTLAKKGTRGREFESGKEFKYANDSISISFFEKAGGTYIFENGKFRYVNESD